MCQKEFCFPIPSNKFAQSMKQKKQENSWAFSPMAHILLKKTKTKQKTNYVTITTKSKQQNQRQNMK